MVIRRGVLHGRIKLNSVWNVRVLPFTYAAVSAMIGTYTVILGKSWYDILSHSTFLSLPLSHLEPSLLFAQLIND